MPLCEDSGAVRPPPQPGDLHVDFGDAVGGNAFGRAARLIGMVGGASSWGVQLTGMGFVPRLLPAISAELVGETPNRRRRFPASWQTLPVKGRGPLFASSDALADGRFFFIGGLCLRKPGFHRKRCFELFVCAFNRGHARSMRTLKAVDQWTGEGSWADSAAQAVSQWRRVPAERVLDVERLTGISRR